MPGNKNLLLRPSSELLPNPEWTEKAHIGGIWTHSAFGNKYKNKMKVKE